MWYKGRLEAAETEARLMRTQLEQQQIQIHRLTVDNDTLGTANVRGANLVNMKHEAGRIFGECTDRVADIFGTMRREIPEVIAFCPEMERILLRADFAHHMLHGVNFVDLTAGEDMDGDTTEEEEEVEL